MPSSCCKRKVASLHLNPVPTSYLFWMLPSSSASSAGLNKLGFFHPIFANDGFHLTLFTDSFSLSCLNLYSLIFPITNKSFTIHPRAPPPRLCQSSSLSIQVLWKSSVSLLFPHIFRPTNLASVFTTTETCLATGFSEDYVTEYSENLSILVVSSHSVHLRHYDFLPKPSLSLASIASVSISYGSGRGTLS